MHAASSVLGLLLLLAAAIAVSATAFAPPSRGITIRTSSTLRYGTKDNDDGGGEAQWDVSEEAPERATERGRSFPNPLADLAGMLSNFDAVVDDFYNKRMGNGEVFYGKRKYKPSGRVLHDYNGGGLTDWRKMEAARLFREERAMQRALRGEFDE